jgi:hypothetical protein
MRLEIWHPMKRNNYLLRDLLIMSDSFVFDSTGHDSVKYNTKASFFSSTFLSPLPIAHSIPLTLISSKEFLIYRLRSYDLLFLEIVLYN